MATVSERSRELMQRLDALSSRKQQREAIEQALLAERRLAMEEAAKIAVTACDELEEFAVADYVTNALRAAAEKEVGTK